MMELISQLGELLAEFARIMKELWALIRLALQQALGLLADQHPGWPRLRIGVNTGEAVIRELGGHGHVAYTLLGDTINTGSRLEGQAPVGGVLICAETYRQLPDGAIVEPIIGLQVKGKANPLDAYVLHSLPG